MEASRMPATSGGGKRRRRDPVVRDGVEVCGRYRAVRPQGPGGHGPGLFARGEAWDAEEEKSGGRKERWPARTHKVRAGAP